MAYGEPQHCKNCGLAVRHYPAGRRWRAADHQRPDGSPCVGEAPAQRRRWWERVWRRK